MKKCCLIVFLFSLLLSCARNDKTPGSGYSITPRVKKQVMGIAINYARDKFKDAKKTVAEDGIINIGDNQIKCAIDPARIVAGLIDDDANEDAIVSISSYNGQFLIMIEHLILIKTDGKLMLARVIEADMKILGIKDRVIFAEIPKVAPDAPAYDCSVCKEVVKYQYKNGDLIRTE